MKYKCGDILLLNNGITVSVIAVDIQNREYSVVNTDDILSILLRSNCLRILRHISDRRGTVKAAHTSARQAAEKAILCSSSQECL